MVADGLTGCLLLLGVHRLADNGHDDIGDILLGLLRKMEKRRVGARSEAWTTYGEVFLGIWCVQADGDGVHKPLESRGSGTADDEVGKTVCVHSYLKPLMVCPEPFGDLQKRVEALRRLAIPAEDKLWIGLQLLLRKGRDDFLRHRLSLQPE